jgi:hypothetical protein
VNKFSQLLTGNSLENSIFPQLTELLKIIKNSRSNQMKGIKSQFVENYFQSLSSQPLIPVFIQLVKDFSSISISHLNLLHWIQPTLDHLVLSSSNFRRISINSSLSFQVYIWSKYYRV